MTDTKKPGLASLHGYFDRLEEEGLREEKANEGYVWTIGIDGTSSVKALGLANVDYTLHLSCSHVGKTPFGVYRGELALSFAGDMSGVKTILSLLGMSSDDDLNGWFRNDRFLMKLRPYDKEDEDGFLGTVNPSDSNAQNEAANQILNALLGAVIQSPKTDDRTPAGFWCDWDFHMTEGDMGTYLRLNGGLLYWYVNGYASTDSSGTKENADLTGKVIFHPAFAERYSEPVDSPFPYTLKLFEDGSVLFTLYNAKGGPVTVNWVGQIDAVPVEDTLLA